ncbi:hypothetical protein [Streptacidiphilus sp. EB103A]|uniref:hypothetical protein n=1 Tax=Streptacidiphilus sp. EB103A TaxID=3156275 RepID=UPI003517620F
MNALTRLRAALARLPRPGDVAIRGYVAVTMWSPRPRRLLLALFLLLVAAAVLAPAAHADGGTAQYEPAGIGDLMPNPIKPPGQGTLFESYSPDAYALDDDLSSSIWSGDFANWTLYEVSTGLMMVVVTLGRAAVVLTQWTFKVVSLPPIETAISNAIAGAAGPMLTTFLPTAVAIGGFVAWSKRGNGSPLGQIAWVLASAAIATTFLTAPTTWVKGVDNGRQLGATVAMDTIGSGLSGNTAAAVPFKTPEPAWSSNDTDNTLRKASDAVWRTYVAVPWCIADLGSLNACQKWGKDLLDKGTDMDSRKDFLSSTLNSDTVGGDAVKWRQGKDPGGRLAVLFAALVTVAIFCALMIGLAFATLASLIGALMLLVCGVAFATLWCIPGKPRQWGVQWFEMLIGLVMVSFTSTMLLGSVMVVSVAMMSLMSTYGWLAVAALNITAAIMAWKVKGRLDGIVSAGGAQMAGRGALGSVGRAVRASRLRRAVASRVGRRPMGDMDRHPPAAPSGGSTGPGRRSSTSRTFPSPPSRPDTGDAPTVTLTRTDRSDPAHAPGGHLPPSRPGLGSGPSSGPGPTGPTGPGPSGPSGLGPGSRPSGPAAPPSSGSSGRTTPGGGRRAGGAYTVRPGAPSPSGPPPSTGTTPTVIRGTTVPPGTANPTGARFRSYPPPSSGRTAPPSSGRTAPRPTAG